ncbi:hypothetical protein BTN49_1282 [Candidatus Enterovibrio escicola]|uniref:Uncharacterized protein n=1 Tax=Candidatus Enterovibrio escicola TaxID=1927127 RepID=A0A2A5T561_9GAMM|nr:hypothetical protein BTN49_1282 [Candidatus Enterovibrio escacola]
MVNVKAMNKVIKIGGDVFNKLISSKLFILLEKMIFAVIDNWFTSHTKRII